MRMTVSATLKYAPKLPATRITDTSAFFRSPILEINGVIGSLSLGTTAFIRASRIMKFVALVSSSMSSVFAPASSASATLAACDVLPLALGDEK